MIKPQAGYRIAVYAGVLFLVTFVLYLAVSIYSRGPMTANSLEVNIAYMREKLGAHYLDSPGGTQDFGRVFANDLCSVYTLADIDAAWNTAGKAWLAANQKILFNDYETKKAMGLINDAARKMRHRDLTMKYGRNSECTSSSATY